MKFDAQIIYSVPVVLEIQLDAANAEMARQMAKQIADEGKEQVSDDEIARIKSEFRSYSYLIEIEKT